jgi:hypothetical protein
MKMRVRVEKFISFDGLRLEVSSGGEGTRMIRGEWGEATTILNVLCAFSTLLI